MKKSNLTVIMNSITWARDSHGLFDYESKNVTKIKHASNNPGLIYRVASDVYFSEIEAYSSAED